MKLEIDVSGASSDHEYAGGNADAVIAARESLGPVEQKNGLTAGRDRLMTGEVINVTA
jgi:hypothetical protein